MPQSISQIQVRHIPLHLPFPVPHPRGGGGWNDTYDSRCRNAVIGLISLGGGLPSSDYFPFEHIEIRVPTVGQFSEKETRIAGQNVKIGKYDVLEGNSTYDLAIALNYGQGTGSAQLLRFVTEHTEVRPSLSSFPWGCVGLNDGTGWDG